MTTLPPAGWYPDPAGEPQWRAWNGRTWASVTRPFHSAPFTPLENLARARERRRVKYFGVLTQFAGVVLGANVLAPDPRATTHSFVLATALTVAVALTLVGTVQVAVFLRRQTPLGSLARYLPVVNLMVLRQGLSASLARRYRWLVEALGWWLFWSGGAQTIAVSVIPIWLSWRYFSLCDDEADVSWTASS